MWDVYLGGTSDNEWRSKFKNEVSKDISVFDPMVSEYKTFNESQRANETAKQLSTQEQCAVIVFYLDKKWKGHSSLIEMGDAVGRGSQVIVCLDGDVEGSEKIRRYCEFQGVLVVDSLEDLITSVEEYMAELAAVVNS